MRHNVRVASIVVGFRPEYLDFDRGVHVGNLEEHERITRILKLALESRYSQPFVTERWGRGVYWQWIGFLARANRAAKPLSSAVSFGCAKFYISVDREDKIFECGFQVERGYVKAPRGERAFQLREDWDWNRLVAGLKKGGPLEREIDRLLDDGFRIRAGAWGGDLTRYSREDYPGTAGLKRRLQAAAPNHWAGMQIFFPMTQAEVHESTGLDLVESMLAVFDEGLPVMNLVMQVRLESRGPALLTPARA
jgi:hypothetical protein